MTEVYVREVTKFKSNKALAPVTAEKVAINLVAFHAYRQQGGLRAGGTPDGTVFMPFAYREAAANWLTNAALDPFGKIPEFKYCAVCIEITPPSESPTI